jgi:uncharacterized protein
MPDASIQVTATYSPAAREVHEVALTLVAGSSVADALSASGFMSQFTELASSPLTVGVWNKRVELTQVLRDQDRVEIYRALKVDPKVARRQRFTEQGAKKAGLFSKSRPSGKTGY